MTDNLTDRGLRGLKPKERQYEIADRGAGAVQGLSLRVLPSGAKRWSFRWRSGRRWGRVAIGPFPAVGLADAREVASEHLRAVKKYGRDPSREKRQERIAPTFAALARRYIEEHAQPRKRTWREDERMIANEIPKSWKNIPAAEVTRADVREVIEQKAVTAPVRANRIRAMLHKVFAFALEREIVEFNPVTGTPRPGVERQRQRVLTEDEIRHFWTVTEPGKEKMSKSMSAFWRLRLVTAQRSGEVNTMRWQDLDLENAWWTIPPERSKNRLAHRVPLSDLALEIVSGLPQVDEYVITGARGKRQQAEAAAKIGLPDFTGHDLRRTAASGMASAGVPRHHIGKVLNHAERGVTATYDRHSYDPEKRAALETWESKLLTILKRGKGGEVLTFKRS